MNLEFADADDLRLLANALRAPGFRFIVVGHNHRSIYTDTADWVRHRLPERTILELPFSGKDYRTIMADLRAAPDGIVFIPDFDWLFRAENNEVCLAFNQRRDFFARCGIAFVCFVQPANFPKVARKLPDWWSGRSVELNFKRETPPNTKSGIFMNTGETTSSLGGMDKTEKEAELESLIRQWEVADPENKSLIFRLHEQMGEIHFGLSQNDKAFFHFKKMLEISRKMGDRKGEGRALNNIGAIYDAKSDYMTALQYWEQSLKIQQAIGDREGEGVALNNISQIYSTKGEYESALRYLEESLKIQQAIGDREGEGATLNNISQIHRAKGNDETALRYLEQSLKTRQAITDRAGEGRTLNNISQVYKAKGDYDTALRYLEQSLKITQTTGDRVAEGVVLNNISHIYSTQGDYNTALRYLEQSFKIGQDIGDTSGIATTLSNMGGMLFEQNRFEEAVPLLLQAHQIFEKIGSSNVQAPAGYLGAIIEQIGEARFQAIVAGMGK